MKKKCTLVLISVLTVACIVFAYLLFFYNPSFNMVYDSDTDSYFNNSYLSYNDGTLAAADYRKTKVTSYDSKNNSTVNLPSNGCLINDNLFYINGNKLCCLDTTTNTRKIIDTDCRSFVCNNEVIAYTKNDSVILKNSDTLENIGDIKFDNQIYYINISDGNLYIAERIFEDKTDEYGYSFKVVKQYIFKKYDLKSCKLLKSKNANYVNEIRYVTVCKDTFWFFCDETQTVNNVCLDKDVNYPTIQHPDVKFITSNNDCVYYISEKTESAIIRKTVESPYNGIWKLEVGSNKPVKIADKCDCDELLATKNFLYCYTINYILPRGVANSWVRGYLIDQLAIS